MADTVRKVNYCYVTVPNRSGRGAAALEKLAAARVNLLGYSGFPVKGGKAQLDFVAESLAPVLRVAKRNGWQVSRKKQGFLIQGKDVVGAVNHHIQRLAAANINVTAADAVCAGGGRYGMLLWVKAKDYPRAAKALRAR